jgi:hypothetical protein
MFPEIMRLQEPSRKTCEVCRHTFKDGDIVMTYVSSTFHSSTNVRWVHMKCMLSKAKDLIPKDEYAGVYDEWLVGKV